MGTGNLTVYLNFIYKIFLVALPQYFKKKKGDISGSSPNGGGKKINTLQFLFYYKRKINIVQNLSFKTYRPKCCKLITLA